MYKMKNVISFSCHFGIWDYFHVLKLGSQVTHWNFNFNFNISSAVAVGTVAGHGIIGTMDGLVYIWELSTGATLGNLHQFKGIYSS